MKTDSRKKLRDEWRDHARQSILKAAERVFARDITSVRIEDIAQEAGLAVGTLYNYFPDRKALLDTVVNNCKQEAFDVMQKVVQNELAQSLEEKLENFIKAIFGYVNQHHAFFHSAWHTEETRQSLGGKMTLMCIMREQLAQLLAKYIDNNYLKPEFADLYPTVIIGLIRGTFTNHAQGEDPVFAPDLAERLVKLFMEGAQKE